MIALTFGSQSYTVIRLNELTDQNETDNIKRLTEEYLCPLNDEVEYFLKNNAFDFSEKKQAVTYCIFTDGKFVAYFTLANKLLQVQKHKISKSILKRLLRTAEDTGEDYVNVPGILVAQLGKNYYNAYNTEITGQILLSIVHYFIENVQSLIGGVVYFLECESDRQKVIDFYEANGFVRFSERLSKDSQLNLLQFMKKI